MNRLSQPLDYILNCIEQHSFPHKFDILNARDELKKLRVELQDLQELIKELSWINNMLLEKQNSQDEVDS